MTLLVQLTIAARKRRQRSSIEIEALLHTLAAVLNWQLDLGLVRRRWQ